MNDRIKMTSPVGVARFPKLNTPDTKFKEEGEYSVQLQLSKDSPENQSFINELAKIYEANYKTVSAENRGKKIKRMDPPWKDGVDRDGNDLNCWDLRIKMPASYMSKQDGKKVEMRPAIFDAKLNPSKAEVGGGSKIRVNFDVSPFYVPALGAGISLRLRAVQVLELSQRGSRSGTDYGFSQADGFTETPAADPVADEVMAPAEPKPMARPNAMDDGGIDADF
jgi:hypothetical protein